MAICENEYFRAFMSGQDEMTIMVMIDYPLGRRWVRVLRGAVNDPQIRAFLTHTERMVEQVRAQLPPAPLIEVPKRVVTDADEEREKWHDFYSSTRRR